MASFKSSKFYSFALELKGKVDARAKKKKGWCENYLAISPWGATHLTLVRKMENKSSQTCSSDGFQSESLEKVTYCTIWVWKEKWKQNIQSPTQNRDFTLRTAHFKKWFQNEMDLDYLKCFALMRHIAGHNAI